MSLPQFLDELVPKLLLDGMRDRFNNEVHKHIVIHSPDNEDGMKLSETRTKV